MTSPNPLCKCGHEERSHFTEPICYKGECHQAVAETGKQCSCIKFEPQEESHSRRDHEPAEMTSIIGHGDCGIDRTSKSSISSQKNDKHGGQDSCKPLSVGVTPTDSSAMPTLTAELYAYAEIIRNSWFDVDGRDVKKKLLEIGNKILASHEQVLAEKDKEIADLKRGLDK